MPAGVSSPRGLRLSPLGVGKGERDEGGLRLLAEAGSVAADGLLES